MTCSEFDRWYVSDSAQQQAALRRHAAACGRCAARLRLEQQIDQAARKLRPTAPPFAWEEILARHRAQERSGRSLPRLPLLARAAAAVLVLAALLYFGLRPRGSQPRSAELLSSAEARTISVEQLGLERRHQELLARSPAAASPLSPHEEEARHLDAAIEECRQALAMNQRHRHLRETLLDLQRRRNRLREAQAGEPPG